MNITHSYSRLIAVTAGVALAFALSLGATMPVRAAALSQTQIQSILSLLSSFGADQATINNVSASLNGQPTTVTTTIGTTGTGSYTWSTNLTVGSKGADVLALQKFLNKDSGTMVASTGAGSPGMETSTFGPATKAAVMKFQTKYGLSPVAGYVGALTRAKLNSLYTTTTTTTNTTTTTTTTNTAPAGTGLTVNPAAQPANGLLPYSASRISFTNFTVTAGTDGDVVLNSVTVQRTGSAMDVAFSGVELIDMTTGLQVGISHVLNSNHQAIIGQPVTIARGTSRTFTVAANRATQGNHGGEIASFSVVALNTSATVTGSLPIVGAMHTVNETLTIGSVSTTTSSFDPGSNQTKNIGDTNVRFSGIRFTAGSGEDLKLQSISWRQTGSVSSADLANVVTNINGVTYPTTVDSTGKYFTTVVPAGILIAKGNSVDAYIQGDIIGSNAASRTAIFTVDKVTDVYFVGQLYGYGVAPSGTYTPWFSGYTTTIQAGTVSTIGKATEVPAQNIAINLSNQPLGGFVTNFVGEPVSVSGQIFYFDYSTGAASISLLTNVSIVDENGAVVAGPQNGVAVSGTEQSVTFSDSVTFPVGRHVYTIKGTIPSTVANNVTIAASTTPSAWTSPTGQTSGNTVSVGVANFTMNTMTIKAAALSVTLSSTPASQNMVAGGQGMTFANVQLDASQSGEDVRLNSIPMTLTVGGTTGAVASLSSCALYDATGKQLNTGSNVPSSLAASASSNTFTLDNSLIIPKGTVTNLTFKCNVSSAATGTYVWSVLASGFTATGMTSGQSVTVASTAGSSGTMTVASATLAVTLDPSSPAYTIAAAGSTGVTLGVYKFHATNDAINLTKIGLNLGALNTASFASSTAADLTQVSLWANNVQIGTATFTGANRSATSTLTSVVTVPKDGDLVITVKGNLATQGVSQPSHPGAYLAVNIDINGATGSKNTQGTGVGSGIEVDGSGSTAVAGVRVFNTFPTIAVLAPSTTALIAQTGQQLFGFTISANSTGNLALDQMVINVATSSVSTANGTTSVTNLKVYAYTDAALSSAVAGYTSGLLNSGGNALATLVSGGNNTVTLDTILTIPAGQAYYFKVVGDVVQNAGTTGSAGSVTTKLIGDASYPDYLGQLMATTSGMISNANYHNFIWSPLSTTTTAATTNIDWTNGYQVPGLPSAGTNAWTLTK